METLTTTETLTENQLKELAESQAALARVAAEQAVPVSTQAPAAIAIAIDRLAEDWKLCDCRTDAKFAALLGKPRECPYAINPERNAWLKEYDRARGFADARPAEDHAFDAGWAQGFHFPKRVDFAVPAGEIGRVWKMGWLRGLRSRAEIDADDPCVHNPGKLSDRARSASPVATKAVLEEPLSFKRLPKDRSEVIRLVLEARKQGLSFKKIDLKFTGKANHGGWSCDICHKYGCGK